ncbi:MAG: molybdopterin-dependent oxidoreductase [Hydrogenothermaceae bacterium]|nr:molybdopterin-dependent oxidoreductase [Hydrogenothermaceae bacterium]
MKRRTFILTGLISLFSPKVYAGIFDAFKKQKSALPPPGKYTPINNLFIVDIKGIPSAVKNLNIRDYKLKIYGKVKNPLTLSLEDIKSMPPVRREIILECVSNSKGDKIGRILVEGVDLNYLLEKVQVLPQSKEIVFRSFDDYHTSIEISYVKEFKPILVYNINYDEDGKILDKLNFDHGYPLRVVCPEKWGYKSAKWIKEIEVVDYDYKGYWEKTGWNDRAMRGVDYFDYR